ncbi:MAG: B12-binding domain-containing radical SAM protein [Thermodesulfobacteriota bacterium]|nr:B12-binding domain-containing radical SAM protein [Thermodesulfobacteriota bacterium]
MHILLATLHVRASAQAVSLAAGCLKACLPPELQQQTKLIDLFPEAGTDTMCQQLLDFNPTIIAFPLYVWNRQKILQLSQRLRQKKPDLILLAGGPEASADSQKVMTSGALDGVIRGEGEVSFAELIIQFNAGKSPTEIVGFLPASQTSVTIPAVAVCPDLSILPSPWLTGQLPLSKNCGVLWEVARGCQFNCAFCYDAKGHQGVRPLSPERLRKELQLFAQQQVAQVWILDSTFNAPPERGKQLLEMLLEFAPRIHYHIEAKADFLDTNTIKLLSRLSCSVQIGLQSATVQVLQPLHRNLQPKQMERRLRQMSVAGITFGLDLIYGLPGDNHAGFEKSLDFTLQQQPNQVDIFPLAVLPGTELFEKQEKFGIRGESHPPYLLQSNKTYSEHDLHKSHLLAAATDIFYNRGRAVGFFLQLCHTLKSPPSRFLQQFGHWLGTHKNIKQQQILDAENWYPQNILPLQQQYVAQQLIFTKQTKLTNIAADLINFHFLCAETLLAEDCRPDRIIPAHKSWSQLSWKLNPAVNIHHFHFALEDLEMAGGASLEEIAKQLLPEPGDAIFLRQQGEVMIESLDADFAQMLNRAREVKTTQQLLRDLDPQAADELFNFAVTQGLLLSVELI